MTRRTFTLYANGQLSAPWPTEDVTVTELLPGDRIVSAEESPPASGAVDLESLAKKHAERLVGVDYDKFSGDRDTNTDIIADAIAEAVAPLAAERERYRQRALAHHFPLSDLENLAAMVPELQAERDRLRSDRDLRRDQLAACHAALDEVAAERDRLRGALDSACERLATVLADAAKLREALVDGQGNHISIRDALNRIATLGMTDGAERTIEAWAKAHLPRIDAALAGEPVVSESLPELTPEMRARMESMPADTVDRLWREVEQENKTLAHWKQYAAYLKSCAKSDNAPMDFDAFLVRTVWPLHLQPAGEQAVEPGPATGGERPDVATFQPVINYCGQPCRVACDRRCDKAWGISSRPREQLSVNEDDYAFLADHEFGTAPVDPGTYEGEHGKPKSPSEFPNKWCVRECERCVKSKPGESHLPLELPSFAERVPNIPRVAVTPGEVADHLAECRADAAAHPDLPSIAANLDTAERQAAKVEGQVTDDDRERARRAIVREFTGRGWFITVPDGGDRPYFADGKWCNKSDSFHVLRSGAESALAAERRRCGVDDAPPALAEGWTLIRESELAALRAVLEQQRCGACRLFKPACECMDKAADQRDEAQRRLEAVLSDAIRAVQNDYEQAWDELDAAAAKAKEQTYRSYLS